MSITILDYIPIVVLTQNTTTEFQRRNIRAEPGAIWILPPDAILIKPPKEKK
jgi:hypothetical protein